MEWEEAVYIIDEVNLNTNNAITQINNALTPTEGNKSISDMVNDIYDKIVVGSDLKPTISITFGPLYGSNAYLQHLGTVDGASYKYACLASVSHNTITANGHGVGVWFELTGDQIEVQLSGQAQGVPLSATLQLADQY